MLKKSFILEDPTSGAYRNQSEALDLREMTQQSEHVTRKTPIIAGGQMSLLRIEMKKKNQALKI